MPTVSDKATGAESALKTLGLYEPAEVSGPMPDVESRREISLPGSAAGGNSRNIHVQKRTRVKSRGVERPVTRLLTDMFFGSNMSEYQGQGQHQGPTDPEIALGNHSHISEHTTTHSTPQRSPSTLSGSSGQSWPIEADESNEFSEESGDIGVQIHTSISLERSIFRGLLPRGPLLDYSSIMSCNNSASLKQRLDTETSTAADLVAWIRAYTMRQENTSGHSGPLDFLFTIVQKDTLNTLRLMDQALTQMKRETLDDNLIQQKLVKWRLLLERFDTELRLLEESLSKFAVFIAPLKSSTSEDDEVGTKSSPLVADLLREGNIEIANLRHRATSFYQSLMAHMSIVESKRGIAEAESVTKLTELAFFFIPLTFSASIFSMQVRELNEANVSISTFIILATIITIFSYTLRHLIRSGFFTRRRGEWIQCIQVITRRRGEWIRYIKSDAHLPSDSPLSTTTLLLWVWRRLGFLIIVVLLVLGLIVCPITALWTRNINRGFKAILTILLLILTLLASYIMIAVLLYVDQRGLHFRRDIFKAKNNVARRERAGLFMWIKSLWVLKIAVASAIAIGPLVAIWTRPLEPGIKVGATAAIGIPYVVFLIYLLLRAMSDGKFNQRHEQDE